MTGEVYCAVGLRGAEIVAASAEPDGLDDLAGTGTVTTDAGKLADIVAYPADPLTVDLDDLPGLTPAFTIVGGRPVHDPGGLLASPR